MSNTPEAGNSADLQDAFPDPYSVVEPCFLSWWKDDVAQGNSALLKSKVINQRTVVGQLIKGVRSPSIGIHIVKSVLGVLKRDGISGLIRLIRNYS